MQQMVQQLVSPILFRR